MKSRKPLHTVPHPCSSCPYRQDVPSGVWDHTEYEKLRRYDDGPLVPDLTPFLCHQSTATGKDTLCRGWLTVHRESPAARVLLMTGDVTADDLYREPVVPLHASGAAAADHGEAALEDPDAKACRMVARLMQQGIGVLEGDTP